MTVEQYWVIRSPLLLLQSILGMLVFAYPLRKRTRFHLRLLLGALLGACLMLGLKFVAYGWEVNVPTAPSRTVLTLLTYALLVLICWC